VRRLIPLIVVFLIVGDAAAQKTVSFTTEDGGLVQV